MAENSSSRSLRKVKSAQSYIKGKFSSTIGLATSILGQVLLGTIKGSKRQKEVIKLCMKDMKHQFSDRVAEDPRQEIDFMNKICNRSHPNFVRFIDAVEDDKLYCMCLEYVSGGDMCTYIQKLKTGIDACRAKNYALQLCKAVYFMHRNGYCHLDLSLENVLWDKKHDTLKLCDFGLARAFVHGDVTQNFEAATIRPGKKGYMAPEIYAYQRFNGEKADVFSLGVIIFILLTGFPPFNTPNASDKCFQYMYYGKLEWLLKQWKLTDIIDADCRILLSKIFCPPKKRYTMRQLLESAWLDQDMDDIDRELEKYAVNEPEIVDTAHAVSNVMSRELSDLRLSNHDSIGSDKKEKEKAKEMVTVSHGTEDELSLEGNANAIEMEIEIEVTSASALKNDDRNTIDLTSSPRNNNGSNLTRKSVTQSQIVKKKRLSKSKKHSKSVTTTTTKKAQQSCKVGLISMSPSKIQRDRERRTKSKSLLLNESSTALLAGYAATVSATPLSKDKRNGDDASNTRRYRSKSLSYSQHHHHSHISFINDLRKQSLTTSVHDNHNVTQIRRDSEHSMCSNPSEYSSHQTNHHTSTTTNASHTSRESHHNANLRHHNEHRPPHIMLSNDTLLISQKYQKQLQNNGNQNWSPSQCETPSDAEQNYFDNDRKEGDDETYPYSHHTHHEGNVVAHEERRLSTESQDAGSAYSNTQIHNEPASKAQPTPKTFNSTPKDHPPV